MRTSDDASEILVRRSGRVSQFFGLVVESTGPDAFLGEVCEIHSRSRATPIPAEVVGLKGQAFAGGW